MYHWHRVDPLWWRPGQIMQSNSRNDDHQMRQVGNLWRAVRTRCSTKKGWPRPKPKNVIKVGLVNVSFPEMKNTGNSNVTNKKKMLMPWKCWGNDYIEGPQPFLTAGQNNENKLSWYAYCITCNYHWSWPWPDASLLLVRAGPATRLGRIEIIPLKIQPKMKLHRQQEKWYWI